ncbi:hypothetical protein C343_03654 [Cryptococcus neoformans C23]|uniref:PLC-like phosphodiesterase n=1 Tax=Cryptococcus neoformans (strain H99 / ATCC 208821 / CBS 10515 / FGSC 9487) TaxID=235443 RepID=J9VQ66_CRYN9|nr:hypothetical protein CNAG_07638 [Cryptococcus neoformans var. grubii H99]AUB25369.1 hypothetical protein CKF44_07638 [Cryptococcus neoformans var. grubii]OWZ42754.1 hypothetical protein C353_03560 [Cryptococcus neoformans var. grubii AD1-83a]OWZ43785.1 hypothetical protein C343_03654 [Cryptococcus neoformans var. grubii C23]OWZ54469.1 hypothetical protein C368_03613 [Cryptococcus neoformans var. grubii 125.91]OXG59030.1 hypothetical protein C354_03497 [Cryptococcus neoformans var. grubii MW|eukprot:XP_012050247.1 hypothetical protein CNAG_07638 [Cryptococcus neoformans var. grubii H99]
MLPHLILSLASLSALPSIFAATTCNGHSELCSQLYSNVTFIGAHDSYAVGSSVADDQDQDVTSQLNDGIRTLQIQAHNASDGIHLCHSSCSLLDGGLMSDYLSTVASWVNDNPNDVITLVIVNSDNLPPTSFSPAFESAGLSSKVYTPSSQPTQLSDWPTLSDMIDAGTTVVAFMDYEADTSSVPYLLDEFAAMWEDAYGVTSQEFGCAVNRSSGDSSSQPFLINHFLDNTYSFSSTQFFVPNKDKLNETNAETGTGSIGYHVNNCRQLWGRKPNHILLDFYNSNGNSPFNVAASLNGVSAPTNTVAAGTASATNSGSAVVSTKSLSGSGSSVEGIAKGITLGLGLMLGVGMGVGRVLL